MVAVEFEMERDVLGLWAGGEGAKQWMSMLTELRNRGVADVFIVCCDGLKGRPERSWRPGRWPRSRPAWLDLVATACATHQKADWAEITAGLKNVYTAATITAAESASPNSHGCRPYADR
ncbi:MAG: putative transposase [Pseudonocardiales bacterium]|jgi:transposase-like protein|nr:putative transposase [Pseudonocardiales bacterium]